MAIFLILTGVLLRLATHFHDWASIAPLVKFLPHIPNFAPIAAIALFGGVYLNKKYALIIPIVAMLIADYFIGFYNPYILVSVYGSFLLIGLVGLWLRNHKTLPNTVKQKLMLLAYRHLRALSQHHTFQNVSCLNDILISAKKKCKTMKKCGMKKIKVLKKQQHQMLDCVQLA